MTEPDLTQRVSKSSTISRYAMAVLAVAVAIVAAELITRLLNAEAIASSMLCAVIFAAWIGGLGPALLAVTLALLAFHYYLAPPINSFTWKQTLFAVGISEISRLILFSITSIVVAFLISAQRKATEELRHSAYNLQLAMGDQKRIEAALLHSEMYLTEAQRLSGTGSFGWNIASERSSGQTRLSESSDTNGPRSRPWNLLSSAPIRKIGLPCNRPSIARHARERVSIMNIDC
jgi:K+-sensing histidine kinase KdpD